MVDFHAVTDEMTYDSVIEKDSDDFVVFEPGIYDFTVKFFEKKRHSPNPQNRAAKLPACPKVVVHIELYDKKNDQVKIIKDNLYIHTLTEGLVSAFFVAIGLKKKGEKLKMKWADVPGCTGKVKIAKNPGKEKDENGNPTAFFNNVKNYIAPVVKYDTESF